MTVATGMIAGSHASGAPNGLTSAQPLMRSPTPEMMERLMTEAEQRVKDAARAIDDRERMAHDFAVAALAPTQAIIAKLEAEVARLERWLRKIDEFTEEQPTRDRVRAALNEPKPLNDKEIGA